VGCNKKPAHLAMAGSGVRGVGCDVFRLFRFDDGIVLFFSVGGILCLGKGTEHPWGVETLLLATADGVAIDEHGDVFLVGDFLSFGDGGGFGHGVMGGKSFLAASMAWVSSSRWSSLSAISTHCSRRSCKLWTTGSTVFIAAWYPLRMASRHAVTSW